jgi:hypothetical protein
MEQMVGFFIGSVKRRTGICTEISIFVYTGDGQFFTAVKRITTLQESENGTRP